MKKIILTIGSISAIAIPAVTLSCGSSNDIIKNLDGIIYEVKDGKLHITYTYSDETNVRDVVERVKAITYMADVDSGYKAIVDHFPMIDQNNVDDEALLKLITLENAPTNFNNQFNQYKSGSLPYNAGGGGTTPLDEHGNPIIGTETLTIDLDTMTVQEAKDWMNKYNTLKTTFNVNIHVLITRSGTPAYDIVWVKGVDRAHSNYGRGENIDIYGPGDDFYDCYYEILAKSQEQP